jgi:hypothetical protein
LTAAAMANSKAPLFICALFSNTRLIEKDLIIRPPTPQLFSLIGLIIARYNCRAEGFIAGEDQKAGNL